MCQHRLHCLNACTDLIDRNLRADHARRSHKHLICPDAKELRRLFRRLFAVAKSFFSGTCIGYAAVDYHRMDAAASIYD